MDPAFDLVPLAVLLLAVTYPFRATPLLAADVGRLPPRALAYLRLVGPAVLAALAAVNTMVVVRTATDGSRSASFHVGVEWLAVLACVGLVAWRKSLLLGLAAAVALVAVTRYVGLA